METLHGVEIRSALGVHTIDHMNRYLGPPPMVGRSKRATFQYFLDKFGWNLRYLFQGKHGVFICSILQAIPTFPM